MLLLKTGCKPQNYSAIIHRSEIIQLHAPYDPLLVRIDFTESEQAFPDGFFPIASAGNCALVVQGPYSYAVARLNFGRV